MPMSWVGLYKFTSVALRRYGVIEDLGTYYSLGLRRGSGDGEAGSSTRDEL